VREALKHIPTAHLSALEFHRLRVWLCARGNDVECERRELEGLLGADPADMAALDRLAQLAEDAGQHARAAELRARKSQITHARDRYLKLYARTQHVRDAEEMAHLAEELGRYFEARVFLTLALGIEPEREDLRHELARISRIDSPTAARRGETRAEELARELEN